MEISMEQKKKWIGSFVDKEILDAANYKIEQARASESGVGLQVVEECVIALRDIVWNGELPDQERQIYLIALLESMERIADGENPARALNLVKLQRRPKKKNKEDLDIRIFISIGKKYDLSKLKGLTLQDKIIENAIKEVTKEFDSTVASVQKVWSEFGSLAGWAYFKKSD
jgi:hypothetical protein